MLNYIYENVFINFIRTKKNLDLKPHYFCYFVVASGQPMLKNI